MQEGQPRGAPICFPIRPHRIERMLIVGADREAFLDAVLNPPEPTDKLVAALKRHRDLLG